MRNPNRIPQVLNRIGRLWQRNPDLRLMQLLSNVMSPRLDPDRVGLVQDPYAIEDDDVLAALDEYEARLAAVNPPR